MASHKYLSRRYVKGKWVYVYPYESEKTDDKSNRGRKFNSNSKKHNTVEKDEPATPKTKKGKVANFVSPDNAANFISPTALVIVKKKNTNKPNRTPKKVSGFVSNKNVNIGILPSFSYTEKAKRITPQTMYLARASVRQLARISKKVVRSISNENKKKYVNDLIEKQLKKLRNYQPPKNTWTYRRDGK